LNIRYTNLRLKDWTTLVDLRRAKLFLKLYRKSSVYSTPLRTGGGGELRDLGGEIALKQAKILIQFKKFWGEVGTFGAGIPPKDA
jgi:hypothetical protein